MSDIIQNTMNKVLGDMARPSKFRCMIYFPQPLSEIPSSDIDVYCKMASVPSYTAGIIEYDYKGRTIPLLGTQEYTREWSCEFYNDENHKLRKMFLDWMVGSQFYTYSDKTEEQEAISLDNRIIPTMSVFQLDYELKKSTIVYNFYNVFPIEVSEIELNYENINQVQTFTVKFSYSHFDYFTIEGPLSANDIADKIKGKIQEVINDAVGFLKDKVKSAVGGALDKVVGSVKSAASEAATYVHSTFKEFLG